MKSKQPKAPAVHIPLQHQSAPKKSWADKEIEKAAEEIRTGQFVPETDEDDFVPVLLQRGENIQNPKDVTMGEVENTSALLKHPRVIEALARLEQEKSDAKTSQEAIEKSQMLYELNAAASKPNQWDGQGRWIGKENEEARIGLILTPFQFMDRLKAVIGDQRVFLNQYAVLNRVALLVAEEKSKRRILLPGEPEPTKEGFLQVGTLQWPCSTEWMVMRFDEYGVPTTAKYLGWRTALLSMIRLGVITEKEAHKAFPVGSGPVSNWYQQQLFEIRNERGVVN